MSDENVELIRRIFDAVGRRDSETVLSLYHPDVEWDHTRGPYRTLMGGPSIYRGHEGLRRWTREFYEAWEDIQPDIEELIDVGDEEVVSVINYRGIGRGSRAKVVLPMAGLWTIRDGQVVRSAWFGTRAEALEAAGIAEQPTAHENVDLARRVMDALSRRDVADLIEMSHPDVEWYSLFAALGPEGGVYLGHEGARRYMSDLEEAWDLGRADVDDALGVGDLAVLVGRIHYRGKGSGVESEAPVGWVLRFREGKLVRFAAFRDPAQVFGALRPAQ